MNALMRGLIATVIVLAQPISNANAATYLFHNDHLGTPQVLTDSDQQVVWQSEQDPFGEVEEVVNVVEQNLRFPGQYFDVETGLHYNYFRDYDSSIGRYVESDPIGLAAGLNTFGYVSNTPIVNIDPYGLVDWPGPTGGSVVNQTSETIDVYKESDNGKKWRDQVPAGSTSPVHEDKDNWWGFDWDYAWVGCQCVRIGGGPITVNKDGSVSKSSFWAVINAFNAGGWGAS